MLLGMGLVEARDGERQISWLKEVRKRGVRVALFDLDDTLTRTYFREGIVGYCECLADLRNGWEADPLLLTEGRVDVVKFEAEWVKMFYGMRAEFEVSPASHWVTAALMARRLGLSEANEQVKAGIIAMWKDIYEIVPEEVPGARVAVARFRQAGIEPVVVTHAEVNWTRLKLSKWTGCFKHVYCVDVLLPKAMVWTKVLFELGLGPEEVIGVGDSWSSDIEPLSNLGVKAFWLNEKEASGVELPAGVRLIGGMNELVGAVIEEFNPA